MILKTKWTADGSRRAGPLKIGLRPARPIDDGLAR